MELRAPAEVGVISAADGELRRRGGEREIEFVEDSEVVVLTSDTCELQITIN